MFTWNTYASTVCGIAGVGEFGEFGHVLEDGALGSGDTDFAQLTYKRYNLYKLIQQNNNFAIKIIVIKITIYITIYVFRIWHK